MRKTLESLIELQDMDRRMMRMAQELRDIPERKKLIEEQLAGTKAEVAEAEAAVMHNAAEVKNLEVEVEAQQGKIIRYRNQEREVKTNNEYRALEAEIVTAQKAISKLEYSELQLMEAADALKKVLEEKQAKLTDEEARVKAEQEAMERRGEQLKEQLERMKIRRTEFVAGIEDVQAVRTYVRIMNNKRDFAIVPIEQDVCGGCHMKLTPQLAHDARSWKKLTACNHCGRLIYSDN